MSPVRLMIHACFMTALVMIPASLWSLVVWSASESSLGSMGAIIDPQAPLVWWRPILSPIIHQGVAHLCGNAIIVWVAALIYSTRLMSARSFMARSAGLAELFTSLYLSASVIAALRVTLSSTCAITEGSIGLSGGALAVVTSLCVQAMCQPPPQPVVPAQAFIERGLMLMVPIALLVVNQHPRADQWSHITGLIVGGGVGGYLGISSRLRLRHSTLCQDESSPTYQALRWNALALITGVSLALAMLRALS